MWSTKPAIIRWIDTHIPEFDIITTKSFQVQPNPGNREPILAEKAPGTYSNAVGLRNPGMEKVREELAVLLEKPLAARLNISISGSRPEEFIRLIRAFEAYASMFELNFSCPHAEPGYGATIGSSPELVKTYMEAIRAATGLLIFPKLTPNVPNIAEIAEIAVKAGADGIAAINTLGPEQLIEPHSGSPILYNPNGHRGGISGGEVFPVAKRQIAEIREALGPEIPILGMGGVSTPGDALALHDAGARIIGLGSVFGRIRFQDRIRFMAEFREAVNKKRSTVTVPYIPHRQAEYFPYVIRHIRDISPTLRILQLDGDHRMDFTPSQYAFLWLPDAGEKPFSIVSPSPLEFIVRKRERDVLAKKGIFTEALFALNEGDTLYARGPYGQAPEIPDRKDVLLVSGGTGIAALPSLAAMLTAAGKDVTVFHGLARPDEHIYEEKFTSSVPFHQVADEGQPGRVLDHVAEWIRYRDGRDLAFYIIGPEVFMEKGLALAHGLGLDPDVCFASLETNNMCGLGICGECECGGELSCHRGTFYDYAHLRRHHFAKLP